jgi:hypothetical protein
MTEVRNEIQAEVTKIYKCRFKKEIKDFSSKLDQISRFSVEIAGLALW